MLSDPPIDVGGLVANGTADSHEVWATALSPPASQGGNADGEHVGDRYRVQ